MRPPLASVDIPGYHGPATLLAFSRLARNPLSFFPDVRERFGDLAWIRIGPERVVLVSDPEHIDALLWHQQAKLEKDLITRRLRGVLGEGLLTSEGERWRTHRRRIAPSFQRGDLARYANTMREIATTAVHELPISGTVDIWQLASTISLDVVHQCLFGTDVQIPAERVGRALEQMMAAFMRELRTMRRFVPEGIPLRTRRTTFAALADLDAVLLDIIQHRRAIPRAPNAPHDLLDRLIEARDDAGTAFSDKELRDEAITLFTAGHETTALVITYALTALSWNPEARARALDELDGVESSAAGASQPYLRAVILETLRLFPPAWGFGRLAVEPVVLGPHTIPAGVSLYVMPWVLHRSTEHFEEPLSFRPERWLDGLEQRLPRGTFLPFGGGPRTCVGQHFAMLELTIILSTLLRSHTFDVDPAHDLDLQPSVTLRPGGPVPARVSRR